MDAQFPADCAAGFRPDRLLGSGGYGQVWLAHQIDLDRQVVVKLLHAETAAQPDQVQRFMAEAQITALLKHPHIVVVLDHGCADGLPWIVYEYVRGESLRAMLDRGPLSWQDACNLGIQVASALEAAHARGILHRDIKPDNVLQAAPGDYKVTDFGIAKWSGNAAKTEHGMILGTPAYLSPQQLKGMTPAFESDIYALGVMLYEAIAGKLPWWDENLALLLQRRLTIPAPPLTAVVPDIPAELERVILRMISPDREQRLPPIEEIKHALERVVGERPSQRTRALKPVTRPDREGATKRPITRSVAVAAPLTPERSWMRWAATAGIFVAGLVAWGSREAARPVPSPVATTAASASPTPAPSASARPAPARFGSEAFEALIRLETVLHPAERSAGRLDPRVREALQRAASDALRMVRVLSTKRDASVVWLDTMWFADTLVQSVFNAPPTECVEAVAVLRILERELDGLPEGVFPGVFRAMLRPRLDAVLNYTGERNTPALQKTTEAAMNTLETATPPAWQASFAGLAHRTFIAHEAAWCARRANKVVVSFGQKSEAIGRHASTVASRVREILDKLKREPAAHDRDPAAALALLAALHAMTGNWDGGQLNRPEDTRAKSFELLDIRPGTGWPPEFAAEFAFRQEALRKRGARRK